MASSAADEGGGMYLSAMTYQSLYGASFERLKKAHSENPDAIAALDAIQESLRNAESASPSFLFDFSKLLLAESKLNINLQESYLRMHANAPTEDLELPNLNHIAQFRELSERAIALRKVLARIPDEMTDRRPFLETIKEIASSIKKLLDTTNGIIAMLPSNSQPLIEKRKREFVHCSKQFSNTLKEYFKTQNSHQVFMSANHLVFQTLQIFRAVREKVRLQ
ncbi:programmed cell death protein 10 like protein [Ditylenchus destructor]|nr:programmed cell death protein 10 like protein [Ditylenchus destructor]